MYIAPAVWETWPIPNYENPETRGNDVAFIHGALYSVVFLVVLVRMYTRLFISRSFGFDDFFILVAMVRITATTQLHRLNNDVKNRS